MKKSFMIYVGRLLLAIALLSSSISFAETSEKPFYGFHPSKLGANFKRFEHNILGFSVDVPNDWTFGINGSGVMTVAILFPEKLDTSLLSNAYETIEVGIIPYEDISLDDAYEFIMRGMKATHPNLSIEEHKKNINIGNADAIEFLYAWQSKNGSIIKEWVHLISYKNQVRSITVRYGQEKDQNRSKYKKIIETYEASDINF